MVNRRNFLVRLSIRAQAVRLSYGGTTMKYILLIHDEEKAWGKFSEDERQKLMAEYRQLSEQLKASGQYVSGSQLAPTSSATSVRVREGKRVVTDGPFAETR